MKNPRRRKLGKMLKWNSYPLMDEKVKQAQDINEQGGGWEKNQTSLGLVLLKLFANRVTVLPLFASI